MRDKPWASVKMPELLVFLKAFVAGFIIAETFRIAHIGGSGLAPLFADINPSIRLAAVLVAIVPFGWYVVARGALGNAMRLGRSGRIDLLAAALLGVWSNDILSTFAVKVHEQIAKTNPLWALLVAAFLLVVVLSAIVRAARSPKRTAPVQLYFLTDEEIQDPEDDVLANLLQAKQFAETVLASGSQTGLVFGIDGPWGTGKTSFINLASRYWQQSGADEVIVFRFEPLRYASDPDLADRFIRDLSAEIQRQAFVPEFQPAATRYSRMLKGKADFSFLGFKLALEPSAETVDELLEDIDDVLIRIRRRVIVVVDDLDRLDAKAVNNVLFTIRRTFKLSQAAYILCYDTENLVPAKEESERARQFLEKFVNVKLSLFVDSSTLVRFLQSDWKKEGANYHAIPAETMLKLGTILSELAEALTEGSAAQYMQLIGDMRKLKRFVNALLLVQLEKTDLTTTDFNSRDVINLMLLHLNYPGTFRRIYVEETEGRSGTFSIKTTGSSNARQYSNADGFQAFVGSLSAAEGFLLTQLFSSENLSDLGSADEAVLASRACFNSTRHRNLEKYLKLIVRFANPEPRETYRLYQESVGRIIDGAQIEDVLSGAQFDLKHGEHSHDEFWRILVSESHDFNDKVAEDAIESLVKYLPRYSSIDLNGRGLRSRAVYSLILLLDNAGWGRTAKSRRANTPQNVVEIAHRILGDGKYAGNALIERLSAPDRGVLGLYDLMLFRLQCSADRGGQAFNLQTALIVRDNPAGQRSGPTIELAVAGMRSISQRVFAIFKLRYIDPKRNFFDHVAQVSEEELMGDISEFLRTEAAKKQQEQTLAHSLLATRSMTISFILYQLTNKTVDQGVGAGYYDSEGIADGANISVQMNDYLFDVCFNPEIQARNIEHFVDFCMTKLVSGFWSGNDEDGYTPTMSSLANELDPAKLAGYWIKNSKRIRDQDFPSLQKSVVAPNYTATYASDLPKVFEVLDQIRAAEEEKGKAQMAEVSAHKQPGDKSDDDPQLSSGAGS
jgi:hypothetical protein